MGPKFIRAPAIDGSWSRNVGGHVAMGIKSLKPGGFQVWWLVFQAIFGERVGCVIGHNYPSSVPGTPSRSGMMYVQLGATSLRWSNINHTQ
jgi:hypothetical protein